MPLEPGKSQSAFKHNVRVEVKAGKPVKQAVAIAYREKYDDEEAHAPTRSLKFYTTTKLGKHQSLTKEGFLLCQDVAIGRIGTLNYGPGESPIQPGRDGVAYVQRDADEVFRPETIASFEGKPVTYDHPPDGVTPANYKEHTVGVVQNVRRGENPLDDFLFADLLIQDEEAIQAVRDGERREVSCGYDAEYEELGPGRGRQFNIIGNHVALVELGRCGPSCAIQDRSMIMAKKPSIAERIMTAFAAKDGKALQKVLDEAELGEQPGEEGSGVQVHVHNYGKEGAGDEMPEGKEGKEGKEKDAEGAAGSSTEECLKRIEALLTKLVGGEGTGDEEGEGEEEEKKEMTGDAAIKVCNKQYQDLVTRAEILSPGFKLPTFDAKKTTIAKYKDHLCGCKKRAMSSAMSGDGAEVLKGLLGETDIDKMDSVTADAMFIAASELMKQKNNASGTRTSSAGARDQKKAPLTAADINKRNQEFWSGRSATATK